jgi:hypothetical protein
MSTESAPITLTTGGLTYYHPNDEAAFFGWLEGMPCVAGCVGVGRELLISLSRFPSDDDLRELLAFYFRYGIDMRPLAQFETDANRGWFRNPAMYWHEPVFAPSGR